RYDDTSKFVQIIRHISPTGATTGVGPQFPMTLVVGDSLGLQTIGNIHRLFIKRAADSKWTLVTQQTDANAPGGGNLAVQFAANAGLDAFGGGSVTTAKAGTDANCVVTESATVTLVLISDSEPTGPETEIATPVVGLSASDSGTAAEAGGIYPISGLVIRLDANSLALADGADVSPWPNLASPGIPGTIVGTPNPTKRNNTLNDGKPVVRFAAGAGRMRMTGTGIGTPFTLLVIGRYWTTGVNAARVISTDVTNNNLVLGWHGQTEDALYDGAWSPGDTNGTAPASTNWHLYSFDKTGASPVRMFTNGVFLKNGGSGTQNLGGSLFISGFQADTAQTSDCEIAELLVYNRVLSDSERQQAESYLRN